MEPLHDLNSLDWVVLAVVFISVSGSLLKGFVRESISLGSVVVGMVLASWFYPATTGFFLRFASSQDLAAILGFVSIFAGCLIAGALVSFFVHKFVRLAHPAVVRPPAGSRLRPDSRMDDRCRPGAAIDGLPGTVG